jgi:hypothetical protein
VRQGHAQQRARFALRTPVIRGLCLGQRHGLVGAKESPELLMGGNARKQMFRDFDAGDGLGVELAGQVGHAQVVQFGAHRALTR